jgi:predicted O-methyltransferase YrrM
VLDDRVLGVLRRLEEVDREEREAGLPASARSRQIPPTTGRFLFALTASQAGIEVLEIGGSRGYSTIWLAAGARVLGGGVVSIERESERCAAWRENIAAAGLDEWAELVEADARDTLRASRDTFDLVFLDAEKEDYEELFALARPLLEPGGLVIADNVLSHADELGAYSEARQLDPTLSSVTVPLDRGLELSVVLAELAPTA